MEEEELPPIEITVDDIEEANQLSQHCPICAGPVLRHVDEPALNPVLCGGCGTLYHQACWEQSGAKCAVLGCDHAEYVVYGQETGDVLQIKYTDLSQRPSANNKTPSVHTKDLKHEQRRRVEQMETPGFWQKFWAWLFNQIKILIEE